MTIQEAIKSGKPFRRKLWSKEYPKEWYCIYTPQVKKNIELATSLFDGSTAIEDILATDWETKNK